MRVFKPFFSILNFNAHKFIGRSINGAKAAIQGMESALFNSGLVGFGGRSAPRRAEMNKTITGRRLRRGMTLVEVVVATFLILMVMAGSYLLIIQSSELSRTARRHYIAISLAKNRLERARNFLYNDLKLMAETDLTVNDNGNPDPDGRFRRTTTVDTNYSAGLTEVIVVVKIRNPHTGLFTPDNETIRTLFTEYLVNP
jgi:prepilin-type N-terminal cleavage/methylation domain-containing protein